MGQLGETGWKDEEERAREVAAVHIEQEIRIQQMRMHRTREKSASKTDQVRPDEADQQRFHKNPHPPATTLPNLFRPCRRITSSTLDCHVLVFGDPDLWGYSLECRRPLR